MSFYIAKLFLFRVKKTNDLAVEFTFEEVENAKKREGGLSGFYLYNNKGEEEYIPELPFIADKRRMYSEIEIHQGFRKKLNSLELELIEYKLRKELRKLLDKEMTNYMNNYMAKIKII